MTERETQYFHEQISIPHIFIKWYFHKMTVYSFLMSDKYCFGSIHQFSFLYKAQSQTHFSVDIFANWKRMCTLLHIFVNVFDNGPNEHLKVWTTLIKTVGLIAIKYISNSNVCFKIIRSKHSSNTLKSLLQFFIKQTLF